MAWATVLDNKMHIVGGYGEQRVDRPEYTTSTTRLPINGSTRRSCHEANHVGVEVLDGKLYAIGGL